MKAILTVLLLLISLSLAINVVLVLYDDTQECKGHSTTKTFANGTCISEDDTHSTMYICEHPAHNKYVLQYGYRGSSCQNMNTASRMFVHVCYTSSLGSYQVSCS